MGVGDGELEQLRLALEVLADERVGDHGAEAHGIEVEGEESSQMQNPAQKSCNISCNKKTLTPEYQCVRVN